MPNSVKTLGDRLRGLRAAAGLSQRGLGKLVGLSGVAVHKIEKGLTNEAGIRYETLADLAAALKTNPDFLKTGKGSPAELQSLSIEEKELVDIYRHLGPNTREALLAKARGMLEEASGAERTVARPFPKAPSRTPS